jgi:hypothetical protein
MSARMVFSEMTWSTYLSLMISAFFKRFIAKNSPDFFCFASSTRPNDPISYIVKIANSKEASPPDSRLCKQDDGRRAEGELTCSEGGGELIVF